MMQCAGNAPAQGRDVAAGLQAALTGKDAKEGVLAPAVGNRFAQADIESFSAQ
ncbi:MAG: hypothetical protein R2864_05260 [Syntrophotaleaceae bacterium]